MNGNELLYEVAVAGIERGRSITLEKKNLARSSHTIGKLSESELVDEGIVLMVHTPDPNAEEERDDEDDDEDEEDQLKFYYVESIDDYWIGRRMDNFYYYADWHKGLGFVWSKSRYLPWGEHVTNEKTLWKEHTYPSEPVEMPFMDWIVGFVKKYFAD